MQDSGAIEAFYGSKINHDLKFSNYRYYLPWTKTRMSVKYKPQNLTLQLIKRSLAEI
jgi:hypothetical protein